MIIPPHIQEIIEKEADIAAKMSRNPIVGKSYIVGAQVWAEHCMELVEDLKAAREQLALMSDGEGEDARTYRTISKYAMKQCDLALAKFNGSVE